MAQLALPRLLIADRGIVKRAVEELADGTHQFHFANEIFGFEQAFHQQIIPEHVLCGLDGKH